MKRDTPSFVWHEWPDEGPFMGHIVLPEEVVAIGSEDSVEDPSVHFSKGCASRTVSCHVMSKGYLSRIQELLTERQKEYGHLSWIRTQYFKEHWGHKEYRRVDIMSFYGHHIELNEVGEVSQYTRSTSLENFWGPHVKNWQELQERTILVTVPDFWWPITAGEDIELIEDVILEHLWGYETIDEG